MEHVHEYEIPMDENAGSMYECRFGNRMFFPIRRLIVTSLTYVKSAAGIMSINICDPEAQAHMLEEFGPRWKRQVGESLFNTFIGW